MYVFVLQIERIDFVRNSASVFGGAIYADDTSSSEIVFDMLHTMAGTDTAVDCFLNLTSDVYFSYDGRYPEANVWQHFRLTKREIRWLHCNISGSVFEQFCWSFWKRHICDDIPLMQCDIDGTARQASPY